MTGPKKDTRTEKTYDNAVSSSGSSSSISRMSPGERGRLSIQFSVDHQKLQKQSHENIIEKAAIESNRSKEEHIQEIKRIKQSLEDENKEDKDKLIELDKRIEKLCEIEEKMTERNKLNKEHQDIIDEFNKLSIPYQEKVKIIYDIEEVVEKVDKLINTKDTDPDSAVESNLNNKWGMTQELIEKLRDKKADAIANDLQTQRDKAFKIHNMFTNAYEGIKRDNKSKFQETRNRAAELFSIKEPDSLGLQEGQTKVYVEEPIKEVLENRDDFKTAQDQVDKYNNHIKEADTTLSKSFSDLFTQLMNVDIKQKSALLESFIKGANGLIEIEKKVNQLKVSMKDYLKKAAIGHTTTSLQVIKEAYIKQLNPELENIAKKEEEKENLKKKKKSKHDAISKIDGEIEDFMHLEWIKKQGKVKQLKTIKDNKERIKNEQEELRSMIEKNKQKVSDLDLQIQKLEQKEFYQEEDTKSTLDQKKIKVEKGLRDDKKNKGKDFKGIVEKIKEKIISQKEEIITLKNDNEELKNKIQKLNSNNEKKSEEILHLDKLKKEQDEKMENLVQENATQRKEFQEKIRSMNEEEKNIRNESNKKDEKINNIINELNNINSKNDSLEKENNKLYKEQNDLIKENNENNEEIIDLSEKLHNTLEFSFNISKEYNNLIEKNENLEKENEWLKQLLSDNFIFTTIEERDRYLRESQIKGAEIERLKTLLENKES